MLLEYLGDEIRLESRARPAQRTLAVVTPGVGAFGWRWRCGRGRNGSISASKLRMIRHRTIGHGARRAQRRGEMLGRDDRACARQRHRALDLVAKFSHIAGPSVLS